MPERLPEKARLLTRLVEGGFNVPDFIYVPAGDFEKENFVRLEKFLSRHQESFKVIARSAHPLEEFYKGGTFDSLETYADVSGIKYARKRIIKLAKTAKRLSIMRQQMFSGAPNLDLEEMGVIVMPYIQGSGIMAKMVGPTWEFGYCCDPLAKIQTEPYITDTPHDRRLVQMSKDIQEHLGFRCEIEYVVSEDGRIWVVQAKDISRIDTLEQKESERSVKLDGVRRIRKHRNYRERPIFVMDNKAFYIEVISKCEEIVLADGKSATTIEDVLDVIRDYERRLEEFAVLNQLFAVLGLSIREPKELYQVAAHYLDDFPELQERLSKALHTNIYRQDYFLAEADTLIAKDRFRVNLGSHDAYGVDTLRNPMWSLYWNMERHDQVVAEFRRLGFTTGDTVGIDIDPEGKPTVFRL
ncbi:MAG: hypothetical protein JRI97_13060 [Deltaproteobacteria bacterium]|nr:hypothetical protein [Deltaproteobacteria bacterium]